MGNAIEFNHVWKKYRKGEKFTSLRDAIPHFLCRLKSNNSNNGENAVLEEREFWALKDASFRVKRGEVVGIIGPNGAGKSTILKLLSGIIVPHQGTVKVNGRLSALIEVTAGFHPELTGRENIYLNGTILGMKKKEIDERFNEIVEFSGIGEFIDTPVKRYSSGMYSRLGFSVAAHVNPDVFLVDEVLAVGDIAFQSKCAQKMRELLDSGVTIILISHNLPLVQILCQRVILLNKGEIIKEGTSAEVIPYYENIVFKQKEEEIKKQLNIKEGRVMVHDRSLVNILGVHIHAGDNQHHESFHIEEDLTLQVDFEAQKKIDGPIFSMQLIRSDGVLCCATSTEDNGNGVAHIEGKGSMRIHLGRLNLAPGIYLFKIVIWDKSRIHPYAMNQKTLLRIHTYGSQRYHNVVFIPKITWDI